MDFKGTISTVGNVLLAHNFKDNCSRAEAFAQKRYFSKMERPDPNQNSERRKKAFENWLESDKGITPSTELFRPNWAIAKILIARTLKGFSLGPVSFTNGSEFTPTKGFNSIESKLSRSEWTCTPRNFGLWCDTAYRTRALKLAVRKKYAKLLASLKCSKKKTDRVLWMRYRNASDVAYEIFCFKLYCVTTIVQGNRFSTVPKNNLKDRPICIEPFANILSQRRIGYGLRTCLKRNGIDLDTLAFKHQSMISEQKFATIDLKDASDRISIRLVKYLLPSRVFDLIENARSEMTLGLDDMYYDINKISSMGNGFTFELMSLILTSLCKSYTVESSVFGDDIIVLNQYAEAVSRDLQSVGFLINVDKTHIYDDYRESCGAHYLDGHGYIESYDFKYPKHIGDVLTIINKLSRLSLVYPSFVSLYEKIYAVTPAQWYANNPEKVIGAWRQTQEPFSTPKLDTFIVKSPFQNRDDGLQWSRAARRRLYSRCKDLQLDPKGACLHLGFEFIDPRTAPRFVTPQRHWAKILMYLSSGRCCKDTIKGDGTFKSFLVVTFRDGTSCRWTSFCDSQT